LFSKASGIYLCRNLLQNSLSMTVSATIKNSFEQNDIIVSTNENAKELHIPGKPDGYGSAVNGGELLFLALATCYCNDVYREAAKKGMKVDAVDVKVSGEFGEVGKNITYEVNVQAGTHSQEEIDELITYVDSIAEIHNTLRKGTDVRLVK
jgi:uncharacterized OsmC-like protein